MALGIVVPFPSMQDGVSCALSSSGGGLPGRLRTRKSRDACFIFAPVVPCFHRAFSPQHSQGDCIRRQADEKPKAKANTPPCTSDQIKTYRTSQCLLVSRA